VRIEELLNYFDYQYAVPENRSTPFRVSTELAPAPWSADAWLLRIGIKAYEVPARERPPANLVFLQSCGMVTLAGSLTHGKPARAAQVRD
jgi:Ca-activated chloride channel family protein